MHRLTLAAAFLAATAMSSVPALADDIVFMLHNKSSYAITGFFASPPDVDSWEDNILESDLKSGTSIRVTIADGRSGCRYDLRFVFEDDDAVEEKAINLCEVEDYNVND
ncbi:hypothetical protein [Afifella sp. IM 167]|uniref:hypothetical protein n=1 Tax=Afifella sp. IM 167 TaxID=2033586 RepID=UPI001CCFBAC1|nr:hypothetical protein [Afifella sp. IM 167]MBZ8133624.1 hypothetical protein [Afifella sp. IM 167]